MPTAKSLPRARRRSFRLPSVIPSAWGLFLRGFLKHPVMVGSIMPSTGRVIRRMLAPVDWESTRVFVEYGPGVGTFCQAVLDRLAPDATYIAIDTNPDFVAHLRHTIRDPRFTVVKGSAVEVEQILRLSGHDHADHILSGLPFSTLPDGLGDAIARATARALRPGGYFLVYQFRPKVRHIFAPYFAAIDHAIEWWNVPPAQLWWARHE